jgi:hypothetical protein
VPFGQLRQPHGDPHAAFLVVEEAAVEPDAVAVEQRRQLLVAVAQVAAGGLVSKIMDVRIRASRSSTRG